MSKFIIEEGFGSCSASWNCSHPSLRGLIIRAWSRQSRKIGHPCSCWKTPIKRQSIVQRTHQWERSDRCLERGFQKFKTKKRQMLHFYRGSLKADTKRKRGYVLIRWSIFIILFLFKLWTTLRRRGYQYVRRRSASRQLRKEEKYLALGDAQYDDALLVGRLWL